MIKVEKSIPMPILEGTHCSAFPDMEIGDSVFLAYEEPATERLPGRGFTARLVTENGITGIRVWRTQ